MFSSILCPVDFSPHSERALAHALDLAALTNARVTLMTAVDPFLDAASAAAGAGATLTEQTQEEIKSLFARLSLDRGPLARTPSIAVVIGEPAAEILKLAVECSADLIVMGTQGLEGANRLMFGSTTEQVLRQSVVPVLAVPIPENSNNSDK